MDIEVSATQDRLAIEAVLFHGQGGTGWVIRVSHLSRRRYYDGFVAGESERGFFLFDERSRTISSLDDESALHRALDHVDAGPPLSPWLTGADGSREARFPFVVWRPCRETGPGVPTLAGLTPEQCRSALAPENLELLRRTTWGHEGRRLDETHRKARSVEWEFLSEFCATLLEGSR